MAMQATAQVEPALSKQTFKLPRMQELGLLVVVGLLFGSLAIYGWANDTGRGNAFLSSRNLIEGISHPMACYAIMAVGMTCVIVTGGIDISVASILAISALSAAAAVERLPPNASGFMVVATFVAVPVAVGFACGLVNGLLVICLDLHPFIVTLGTMAVLRGLGNVTNPIVKTLTFERTPNFIQWPVFGFELMPMIVMLVVAIAGAIYLQLMVYGRETYAVGGNEVAARFSGLSVKMIKLRVYIFSGVCAGIAGMVSLGRFGTFSTDNATGDELTVVAAAVVGGASLMGGRGTAIGALLGTLVLALIQNGISIARLNENYRTIIVGTAIVIAASMDRLSVYLRARRLVRARG